MINVAIFPSEPDPPLRSANPPADDARLGNQSDLKWAPEHDEALKKLRVDGYSSSQIARMLNDEFRTRYTRNAVIGRAKRLGLCEAKARTGPKLIKRAREARPALRLVKARNEAIQADSAFDAEYVETGADEIADLEIPVCPNRVSLLSANSDQCRWPAADDGSATMVCGDPVRVGSYCLRHARISIRRPTGRMYAR